MQLLLQLLLASARGVLPPRAITFGVKGLLAGGHERGCERAGGFGD